MERWAEEERDQTISSSSSSSSERESLAHLVLEVSERTSREDAREVVIAVWMEKGVRARGSWRNGKKGLIIYLIGRERAVKGLFNDMLSLSDPPIYQAASISRDRNLLNIDASSPDSPLQVPHDRRPLLLQHNPISPVVASKCSWHCDARTLPVANLIVVICPPSEQVHPSPAWSCTRIGIERE